MSMELQEALVQISAIRHQMARSEQFRGYRAAPVATSGMLAFAAGTVQAMWITNPSHRLDHYLSLWIAVAAISQVICIGDVWRRHQRSTGRLHLETTHLALEQFYPCVIAGGLLTVVVARFQAEAAWMLPGLWAVFLSLGLFASWRLLPRAIFGVACYYLAGGLYFISLGNHQLAFSPSTMPLLFGVGQLLTAVVLFASEKQPRRIAE